MLSVTSQLKLSSQLQVLFLFVAQSYRDLLQENRMILYIWKAA